MLQYLHLPMEDMVGCLLLQWSIHDVIDATKLVVATDPVYLNKYGVTYYFGLPTSSFWISYLISFSLIAYRRRQMHRKIKEPMNWWVLVCEVDYGVYVW